MKHLFKVLIVLSLTVMLLMNMASCKSVVEDIPFLDGPSTGEETTTTTSNEEKDPPKDDPSSKPEDTSSTPEDTSSSSEPEDTSSSEPEDTSSSEPEDTSSSEPEDTSSEPEDTSSEPEDTSSEPEDTSSEPEDTSSEPEDTSSEPEDTSSEPEDTSSEPEDTSSEPEDTSSSEPEDTSSSEPEDTSSSEPEDTSSSEPEDTTEPGGTTPEPDDTPTWTLVTDVSTLQAGDKIIIVAKDFNFALSITQNTNNRAQAAVTKDGTTITFGDDVQILVLEAGTKAGTYAFNTGAGYLYAASSTKNYLRTQDTLNDNGSWSIEIAADGTATIKANGTNTRNWLRYNSTNNPPLFACYGTGQADVVIYKLSGSNSGSEGGETPCEHTYDNDCDTTCNKCGEERTTEHADNNNDHKCDACGETLTQCADGNKDHKCDVCSKVLSECINTTLDHNCDVCGKTLSECADLDSDHECDICFLSVSDCKDDNNNHICDICNAKISKCNDGDQNHFCDICGTQNSHCQDITSNHYCDWCGEKMTDCADGNKDHKCDVCSKVLSECINTTLDHDCDVCGKTLSECADLDSDHECDICFLSVSDCKDDNNNHICDICNAKISKCNDGDQNHFCDICGTQNSHCQDITSNHYCDWCGEKMTDCADGNKDHKCDVCSKVLSECINTTLDHECDVCGKTLSECADLDSDHECDTCFLSVSDCKDDNNNHICDICNAKISKCNDGDQNHFCDICGTQNSHCQDITSNHYCDWCGEKMTEHTYGDWIIDIPAAEGVEGKKHQECSICGDKNEEIIPALDHEHNYSVTVVDPTCTTGGYTQHVCGCGDSYVTDEKAALGHTRETVPGKDATCTEDGLTDGVKCSVCGATITSQETIPATGHATEVEYWTYNNDLYLVPVCGCLSEKVLVDATNGVLVENEKDLVFLLSHGIDVILGADINLTATIDFEGSVATIDLNGKTLKADWESEGVVEVIHVHDGSHLTIVGEGNVISGGDHIAGTNSVISCRVYSQLTIKGGNFYSASYGDVIFCETNSIVRIEGGHFEAAEPYSGAWYVLDIDESETTNRGQFVVTGGTFVNFDPANHTNDRDYTNKVADGYHSIKDGNNYVVSAHSYTTSVTAPTCTANGYTTYTCVCGDSYVADEVAATGHNYEAAVTAPTCTATGYTTYTCECGESYVDDEVAATGHNYEAAVTAPTCTAAGYTTYTCECGESYVDDEVAATGHTWVDATCTAPKTCSECNATEGDPIEHSWTDATCTAPKTCSECEATEGAALGHNFVDGECTNDGCIANQIINETKFEFGENGAANHNDGSDIKETSYTVGNYKLTLSDITKVYSGAYDAKGNSCIKLGTSSVAGKFTFTVPDDVNYVVIYVASYKAKNATVTINGKNYQLTQKSDDGKYDAIQIDTSKDKTITFATTTTSDPRAMINTIVFGSINVYNCNHQYVETRVEAKCTVDGLITNTCSECNKTKVTVIPATGHSYDDGVVTAPTCTEAGYTTYTCGCGHSYTDDTVDATGHSYDEGVVTAPTCVDKGYTTYTCTCGDSYTDDETEATGVHTFDNGECTVCGALDHVHDYNTVVTDPTCTEKGYTTYTCKDSECGDSYVDDYTDALGHTAGETVKENEVAAGCTTNGSYDNVVYCSACEDEISREPVTVEAKGHTFNCGACACGQKLSVETTTNMNIYANKGTTGSNTISWTSNGITFTNTKGSTDIRTSDSDHYRVYANSNVTISGSNITKIVITCQSNYVPAFGTIENATVTTNGTVVTITLKETANSITLKASSQWRLTKIAVTCVTNYTMSDKDTATHEYTTVVTDPTCTTKGYTTYTCKCGSHTDNEVAALGHSYDNGVVTPPTCVDQGYTTYTCATCDDKKVDSYVDATENHTYVNGECSVCGQEEGHVCDYTATVTAPTCVAAGFTTYTCACGNSYTDNETQATGEHTYENGKCSVCNAEDPDAAPIVVLELTKADFNTTSYDANNNTKTKNGYSYTSNQVMQQNSTMQWQKSKGYITIASNKFVKLEIKSTAGTFTVSVGGKTITATAVNGVNTYDLSGLSGEVKISVGSATGKVDYIKFYA